MVDVSVGRALLYALQAQMMLSQAFVESVPLAGRPVSPPDFLRGCAVLLHAIKACLRTKQLTGPWGEVSGEGPRLEYLSVQRRVQLFALLGWLLENWPERCMAIANQIGLRQIHFEPCANRPAWIVEIVEQLTPRSRPPRKRWTATLTKGVRTIESNGGASCRSERAAVLLRAVRDYHGN
ncbi:hypothetical protein [Pseudoduganella umbonata]|nr:hypothetical protein [Pseudoduganella umbonata]MBB3224467.1 hypothetical protein [Pseudoduganella umbonata]